MVEMQEVSWTDIEEIIKKLSKDILKLIECIEKILLNHFNSNNLIPVTF